MFTKADIEKYFNAEKSESLLFIIIGIVAIVLALIFSFYLKTNWHKGFAIPFLVVGLMHLTVCFTVYNRSDADRKRNVYAYDMNPGDLKAREMPRIKKVNTNFVVYRFIEIGLLIVGAGLFFYFQNTRERLFFAGLGAALAIEAAISLGADIIAERRAHQYMTGLQNYIHRLK